MRFADAFGKLVNREFEHLIRYVLCVPKTRNNWKPNSNSNIHYNESFWILNGLPFCLCMLIWTIEWFFFSLSFVHSVG